MLGGLGHFVFRRRKLIVVAWIGLAIFGAYSASQVSKRWLEQFSIPGYPAYEANQRALKTFGTGEQPPLVAVFTSKGDVTKEAGIPAAIARRRREGARLARRLVLLDRQQGATSRATATRPSPRSTRPGTAAST